MLAASSQVASALAARHIGGAVNYVGVAETLKISGSAQAAGLAADNLLCAAYFATVFALARHIPADATNAGELSGPHEHALQRVDGTSWRPICDSRLRGSLSPNFY